MSDYQILTATTDDIPQLAFLINSAFRGEQAKQGWTTEATLIEGDKRIDEPALQQIMANPKAIIKKCLTGANGWLAVFIWKSRIMNSTWEC